MKWKTNMSNQSKVFHATSNFDLCHGLDLRFSKPNFEIAVTIAGIAGLIDIKWIGSKLTGCWASYVALTFDSHMTLTLDFQDQISQYLKNWMTD